MAENMAETVERVSALAGDMLARTIGSGAVRLSERRIDSLFQLAAWPDRLAAVGARAAEVAGTAAAPGPGQGVEGSHAALLRTEPLKWWLVSETPLPRPEMGADGTALDLSHARTVIRVEGEAAADLMARFTAVDFRPRNFAEGRVVTTGLDGLSATVHRRDGGLDLYVMRSMALTLWQRLEEAAAPLGLEVMPTEAG